MEYIGTDTDEQQIQYMRISNTDRVKYEEANESLSFESFLGGIDAASGQFIEMAQYVLRCADNDFGRICLDTNIAERFYRYAVEGQPDFLYTYVDGVRCEINESYLFDFATELSVFLAYNELFTCLDESMGGTQSAYPMMVVLNMFFARLKIDAALYSDQEFFLGIPEIALLARMKEKSVRNFAHRSLGAQHDPSRRITFIPARTAYQWLKDRRKFIPSTTLETEYARRMLVSVANDFA